MSFVYTEFIVQQTSGFTTVPSAWDGLFLAMVDATYIPDKASDIVFTDIPGGAVINDGQAGPNLTFSFFTFPSIGLKLQLASPTEVWPLVSGGPCVALVLYGSFGAGAHLPLIAYIDDWAGLPLILSGADVPLTSVPDLVNDSNIYAYETGG